MRYKSFSATRVLHEIEELSKIGRCADGSITRLAYSKEDVDARGWLVDRMERAGLQVEVDAVGNVFGWLLGNGTTAEPILIGSHIDSVPYGGTLDGTLGVLCGLEIARAVIEQGKLRTTLGILSFACEEGSRFGLSSVGSRALSSGLTPDDLHRIRDRQGTTLWQALESAGLNPAGVQGVRRNTNWFRAYLEVHIDQGSELDEAGVPVAIVTGIAGVSRYNITFAGHQAHAGAARMNRRRDALAAAAEAILIIEEEARTAAEHVVATVGVVEVIPGTMNVVPGLVRLGLEVRALSAQGAAAFDRGVRGRLEDRMRQREITLEWETLAAGEPVPLSESIRATLVSVCLGIGVSPRKIVSWPNHDALHMAAVGPAGMLLIRNQGRRSHHRDEAIRADDLEVLLRILWEAVFRLAKNDQQQK